MEEGERVKLKRLLDVAWELRVALANMCEQCEGTGYYSDGRWNRYPYKACPCICGQVMFPDAEPGREVDTWERGRSMSRDQV